jgi:hypothetical protein
LPGIVLATSLADSRHQARSLSDNKHVSQPYTSGWEG